MNLVHLTLCSSFSEKSYWLFCFRDFLSLSWSSQPPHPHLLITECETTDLSPPQWLLSGHPPVHNPEPSQPRLLPLMSPSILCVYIFLCNSSTCCVPTRPDCPPSGMTTHTAHPLSLHSKAQYQNRSQPGRMPWFK